MKSTGIILLCLTGVLFLACPETPEDEVNPYRQEQIPWPSLADSPWPMFQHDPQGTGRSQYSGPQTGEIAFTFNDNFWFESSVIIGNDNRLYFVSSGDSCQLYALTDSMEIAWKSILETDFEENPAVPVQNHMGTIFIGKQGPTVLYAIDSNGNPLWALEPDESGISNVTLDREGNLYFANGYSFVSVSDHGVMRWKITQAGGFSGYLPATFSPDGSTLYISGADSLYAVSVQGSVIWTYPKPGIQKIAAAVLDNAGNIIFYNPGDSCITSLNASGQPNWLVHQNEIGIRRVWTIPAPTLDINGNICFLGQTRAEDIVLISVTNDGAVNWMCTLSATGSTFGSGSGNIVSDVDGNIFYCSAGALFCVSPEGIIQWETAFPVVHHIVAMSIGANGTLYITLQNNPTLQIIGIK